MAEAHYLMHVAQTTWVFCGCFHLVLTTNGTDKKSVRLPTNEPSWHAEHFGAPDKHTGRRRLLVREIPWSPKSATSRLRLHLAPHLSPLSVISSSKKRTEQSQLHPFLSIISLPFSRPPSGSIFNHHVQARSQSRIGFGLCCPQGSLFPSSLSLATHRCHVFAHS